MENENFDLVKTFLTQIRHDTNKDPLRLCEKLFLCPQQAKSHFAEFVGEDHPVN